MRREDVEEPRTIADSKGIEIVDPFGRGPRKYNRPRVKKQRLSEPPMRKGEGIEGCPFCVRAGKQPPNRVVYGKDRCIDHMAIEAEGMQLEKVLRSQPVKTRKRLPGALS